MEGQQVKWWDGSIRSYSPQPDNYKDVYQTGYTSNANVAISNQSEAINYRFSASRLDYKGTQPGNTGSKNSFNLNSTIKLAPKLSADVIVSYVNTITKNRPYQLGQVLGSFSGFFSRAEDMNLMKEKFQTSDGYKYAQFNQLDRPEPFIYNIRATNLLDFYWQQLKNEYVENENRLLSSFTLNYDIAKNLKFRGRIGNDYTGARTENRQFTEVPIALNGNTSTGGYTTTQGQYAVLYGDALLTYSNKIGKDLNLSVSGGYQGRNETYKDQQSNTKDGLVSRNWFAISNSFSVPETSDTRKQQSKYAYLGILNLSYKDFLFLEGTARQEYASTLPPQNNKYSYYSLNGGFVFSDVVKLPSFWNYGKLRASYGVVGNAPPLYESNIVYTQTSLQTINGSVPSLVTANAYGNNTLMPEKKHEAEFGLETRFLEGRLGLDVSYYNNRVKNQIVPLQVSSTAGATSQIVNVGEIGSKGFEVALNATPVKAGKFRWDTRLNFSSNKSRVISLMEGMSELNFYSSDQATAKIVAKAGEELGNIYVRPRATDSKGNYIINADDGRFGGKMLAPNLKYMRGAGMLENSMEFRDAEHGGIAYTSNGKTYNDGVLLQGVNQTTGLPNTKVISAADYYINTYNWGEGSLTDAEIFDNSFIKMREVVLSYKLPASFTSKLKITNLRVSLIGRNLFYIWRTLKDLDPEAPLGNKWWSQGVDVGSTAASRNYVAATSLVSCKKAIEEKFYNPEKAKDASVSGLFTAMLNNDRVAAKYWNMPGVYAQTSYFPNSNSVYQQNDGYSQNYWDDFYATGGNGSGSMAQYRSMEVKFKTLSDTEKATQAIIMQAAKVVLIEQAAKMVDLWGDIPYSETGSLETSSTIVNPKFDEQKALYTSFIADLATAGAYFKANPTNKDFSKADILLKGDVNLWARYANSLRLRLLMRISKVDEGTARTAVLDMLNNPAAFPLIDGGNNPSYTPGLSDVLLQPLTNSTSDLSAAFMEGSWYATDYMLNTVMLPANDPRIPVIYDKYGRTVNGKFVPNATYKAMPVTMIASDQETKFADYSVLDSATFLFNQKLPGIVITASEVNLLKAEAFERWGSSASAQTAYGNALRQSVTFYYYLNNLNQGGGYVNVPVPDAAAIDTWVNTSSAAYTGKEKILNAANYQAVQAKDTRKTKIFWQPSTNPILMKKQIIIAALLICVAGKLAAQENGVHQQSTVYEAPTDPLVKKKLDKWQDQKFGMIIHWGLYAVPGIIESWTLCSEDWIERDSTKTYDDYKKWYWGLSKAFNPVHFNPEQWAKAGKSAGMKYLVFTTKHHDGFAMFDTKESDFSIAKGPFAKNPKADVAKYVFNSFRKEGFMIGAYFSKPDWHSEYYWWSKYATPNRNNNYDIQKNPWRWNKFKGFAYNQLEELMTRYGGIDILWLDGGWVRPLETVNEEVRSWGADIPKWSQDIDMPKIARMARKAQPGPFMDLMRTIRHQNKKFLIVNWTIPGKAA
ncbi:unnamed protein product [Tuber aestivum]|uniref:alpha-L-fucosidase n=1 Tax=Tuber aestivum TaxID=59557 RepID=A0A292PJK5_9PEZI|nr:unnamed protein product [Tuber aestivum]